MIIAPINNVVLRATVRRAALPEEDVLHLSRDVREALQFGFPRLMVCEVGEQKRLWRELGLSHSGPPVLSLGHADLRDWESAWEVDGLAVSRIDDSALRLRGLMGRAAGESVWVEGIFSDLTEILGRGLPPDLRGFFRRVLEFPSRYASLGDLEEISSLSPGALKARFRRRGLPSPSRYLRWLRVLASARVLSDPGQTTLTAAFRLGFTSDGNFCRWIQATSGLTPSALRVPGGRLPLLLRMTRECLPEGALQKWESMAGLFLRKVA